MLTPQVHFTPQGKEPIFQLKALGLNQPHKLRVGEDVAQVVTRRGKEPVASAAPAEQHFLSYDDPDVRNPPPPPLPHQLSPLTGNLVSTLSVVKHVIT